jgi:hypothetical protein
VTLTLSLTLSLSLTHRLAESADAVLVRCARAQSMETMAEAASGLFVDVRVLRLHLVCFSFLSVPLPLPMHYHAASFFRLHRDGPFCASLWVDIRFSVVGWQL